MKKILLTASASLLAIACSNNEVQNLPPVSIPRILLVVVYDITKSDNTYAILEKPDLEKTYDGMGRNGGGTYYGLHIKTNSSQQDPVRAEIAPLQQMDLRGNTYQRANRQRKNEEMLADFMRGKDGFLKAVAEKLILPKNHSFSDVKNALEMSRQITENPLYSSYRKYLIIISDLENDTPPNNGIDKMSPVHFKKDLNIFLVRPSGSVKISEVMPGIDYTTFTTIDDAINSVFPNIKIKSHE